MLGRHAQIKITDMTKSRSKQNKDALPKQTKKANQRHNMKEKKDIMEVIISLLNLEILFEPTNLFFS